MFSAETYQNRREALTQKVEKGIVLFLGNLNAPRNYKANIYPFRQDSNFLYFIGLDQPGLAATIDLESGETVLYGHELTLDDIVWTGPLPALTELAEQVGVKTVKAPAELDDVLKKAKAAGRTLHFTPPYRGDNKIMIQRMLDIHPDAQADAASLELVRAIISIREIKTAEEIAQIDRAVTLTTRMHRAAMRTARPGLLEAEIASRLYQEAIGADSYVSFPPITTVRGETLHNEHYHNTLQSGHMLLVDCGGESPLRYAGDMTRTYPVDPKFTTKQREVYEAVLAAEEKAAQMLKPGIAYRDVHLESAHTLVKGLSALGIMKGDSREAVAKGAHALFFCHGLGHMMGLDVHDMEDLGENHVGYGEGIERSTQFGTAFLRLGKPLKAGFVLTVEPGCYFIPALIDQWKKEDWTHEFVNYEKLESYRDFGGIRIEEDFLITADGSKLLGEPLEKSVADVENLRTEAFQ